MSNEPLTLRAALSQSSLDARRGVVRMHYQLMEALGARAWDVVTLTAGRSTGAIAAFAAPDAPADAIFLDDLTMRNCGVQPGESLSVALVAPDAAIAIDLVAPGGLAGEPNYAALRFALLGKVLAVGDEVGLLPQDFTGSALPPATQQNVLGQLAATFGSGWQDERVVVGGVEPDSGLVRVTMATTITCLAGEPPLASTYTSAPASGRAGGAAGLAASGQGTAAGRAVHTESGPPPTVESLPGLETQIAALREWLDLGFHRAELLSRMGAKATMGVLITGPAGSGKAALVEAAAASVGAGVVRLWGPALARIEPAEAVKALNAAYRQAEDSVPSVLLLEQVHEIAARDDPGPLTSVLLEYVANAVASGRVAIVCTTDRPEATSPQLRSPGALDHELTITLPHRADRLRMLAVHTRPIPLGADVDLDEVARRTPGFVAADIKALCHEAALRAALRLTTEVAGVESTVIAADFDAALEVVAPSAMDGRVELGGITLADVGDMAETKRLLTESVMWPLNYPETFERLGVPAPHGALLYGPPGCGKTFLVRALAAEAAANFLSIRGAELLSKWVGESERGVRELFRRARSAAPSIIFFDEIDALASQRGSDQNGTTDRVVAALLTELDGVEALRDVYVLAATNRPELIDAALLRPGRLDTMIYVPPPDPEARVAILRTVARRMPIEEGVDLDSVARACEGYSAADLQALGREAAMTAMRENLASPLVTGAHFAAAVTVVRPSLQPAQVAELEAFAQRHKTAAG